MLNGNASSSKVEEEDDADEGRCSDVEILGLLKTEEDSELDWDEYPRLGV